MGMVMALSGPASTSPDERTARLTLAACGALIAGVGCVFLLGRRGWVVGAARRELRTWWGLLAPLRARRYDLNEFGRVVLAKEERTVEGTASTAYVLRLDRADGETGPRVEESGSPVGVRRWAKAVAGVLQSPLYDLTGGELAVHEPDRLDEPLHEWLVRQGGEQPLPEPPAGCRVQAAASLREMVFDIPPRGYGVLELVLGAVGAALAAGGVALSSFILSEANDKLQGGIAVVPVLLIGLGLGGWLVRVGVRLATERETVTVSPLGLVRERADAWGEQTDQMPADAIEQIEAQEGGVGVMGEGRMLLLGRRLLPAERRWLAEALRLLIARMPRPRPT